MVASNPPTKANTCRSILFTNVQLLKMFTATAMHCWLEKGGIHVSLQVYVLVWTHHWQVKALPFISGHGVKLF